jgi:hypothetical protein
LIKQLIPNPKRIIFDLKTTMQLKQLLLQFLLLPTLFFAQSKKEEILVLNARIDSITNVCNTLNLEKAALQREQLMLKEEFTSEKGLLQNELSETQKQLESVKKTFQSERELRLQIAEKKRSDSLHFVSEIEVLQEANRKVTDSLRSIQEVQAMGQKAKLLNGTYYNSKNQVFTISKHTLDEAFDFSFKYGVNDEWGCMIENEGTAKRLTTEPDEPGEVTYYVGEADYPYLKFKISNGNTIYLQADPEFIGMDCAKFGESQQETYTKFIRR